MKYILAICTALFASQAAAEQDDPFFKCFRASIRNDMETVNQIADEILSGELLPENNADVIRARKCIETSTGVPYRFDENTRRFSKVPKSILEAQEKARQKAKERREAEQAAKREAARKAEAERKRKLERLKCEKMLADFELAKLEGEQNFFKILRELETDRATQIACVELYERDSADALLNAVCQGIFKNIGLPNTKYSFDHSKLENQRVKLAGIEAEIAALVNNGEPKYEVDGELNECRELLSD